MHVNWQKGEIGELRLTRLILRLGILTVLALTLVLCALPVYADQADPDTTPTVDQKYIWRNLIETGDWLVLLYANIPYSAPLPDDPVTSAFIWRLMHTDNVTELGSTTGYAYNDSGYGYNVYSLYFNADNVTALGLAWGTPYHIRLSGNPAIFADPKTYNFQLDANDYSTMTTTADVRAELAARILTIAADLDQKWARDEADSLLSQSETGPVLSIYGEAFFRGAIYGLQSMAPSVFSSVIRDYVVEPRTWDPEYSENLTAQWGGTWIDTAQAAGKALFGTDYDLFSVMIILVLGIALFIGNIMLTSDHWNALIDVALLMVIGARLAMFDLAFLILIAALCWFYIGTKVWFGLIKA